MRFRRRHADIPADELTADETTEVDDTTSDEDEPDGSADDASEPTDDDLDEDITEAEPDDDPGDDDLDDDVQDDDEEEPADDEEEELYDDPAPTGRFAWLKPRKKKIDYGPDFTVKVATLPDLERFPEDGHVHPEIVRSWMALQQFGEAMLLVSWVQREPAGYVLVSWTGDWDDEVRAEYPNTPALCNLWADEQYAAEDVEKKLIEAAITVCEKQGKRDLLATVEAGNTKVRGELEELGFEDTGVTTSEKYVYRDADGKKRRGAHENVVLRKDL